MSNLKILLKFGAMGAVLAVLIALVGFWILAPDVDSLFLFLLLRAAVGATVAMIVGPMILRRKNKS